MKKENAELLRKYRKVTESRDESLQTTREEDINAPLQEAISKIVIEVSAAIRTLRDMDQPSSENIQKTEEVSNLPFNQ